MLHLYFICCECGVNHLGPTRPRLLLLGSHTTVAHQLFLTNILQFGWIWIICEELWSKCLHVAAAAIGATVPLSFCCLMTRLQATHFRTLSLNIQNNITEYSVCDI